MIESYKYGCFHADGKEFLGDLKIKNNKAHYWQELEDRKLRISHIKELIKEDPDFFVIGTGAGGLLQVGQDINEFLQNWTMQRRQGQKYFIKKNTEAIKIINDAITNNKKVCALLAGGC